MRGAIVEPDVAQRFTAGQTSRPSVFQLKGPCKATRFRRSGVSNKDGRLKEGAPKPRRQTRTFNACKAARFAFFIILFFLSSPLCCICTSFPGRALCCCSGAGSSLDPSLLSRLFQLLAIIGPSSIFAKQSRRGSLSGTIVL